MKLAGLALAVAAGLTLGGCQPNSEALGAADTEFALRTLKSAPEHGFAAQRFDVARIERLLHGSGRERAEGEQALRAAVVDYARAQHGLTIPTSAFPKDWGLKPAAYDAEASLAQALRQGDFKDWLAAQPPALSAYQVLQKAYVSYLTVQAHGGWPAVAPIKLTPETAAPQLQALRARLAFEDPQLAQAPPDGLVDEGLIAAVQRFQAAHGLQPTGELDGPTVQELNVPPEGRAAQIRASLERLRWLPRVQPATRIDVNTAAATMDYFVDGRLVTHMLAASGKPGDETPMLASAVDQIVLNPPWNVPQEIADEEILPKGPEYLASKGFEMKDGRLVQRAGPEAALGVVKFDFDNPYAVYLHDTPAKAAFAQSQRAVSHGCVRLAQAVDLAKLLLANEPGWPPVRVDETIAAGETRYVKLSHKTPVRLVYLTAFPEGDRIGFRPDIYGWDASLLQLLDHPPRPRQAKAGRKT